MLSTLSTLISLILLIWVLRAFDLAEVGRALRAANYLYLLPVALLILVNFAVRALRWGTLFGNIKVPGWSSLFVALMTGYLVNNILPAHAGELVRVYMMGRRERLAKSTILATVVVERVADLTFALILLTIVLLFYPLPAWFGRAGSLVGAITLAALFFLIMLNVKGLPFIICIVRLLRFLPTSLLLRIEAVGNGFLAGVSGLRQSRRALEFFGWTALIWSMETVGTFLMARAFHLPILVSGCLFIILFIGLGTMVPSSPGYVGTYEFFATSALTQLGVVGGAALSFAIALHAVTFLGTSLLGAACLVWSGHKMGFIFSASIRNDRRT
jgi:uncharacterized protein (TIRG00374 family)